jgi:hypothetical protein
MIEIKSHRYNNFIKQGRSDDLPSFGMEIELSRYDERILKLIKLGFIPSLETDTNVAIELKSNILLNTSSLSNICAILEQLKTDIISTHVHINVSGVRVQLKSFWEYFWNDKVIWLGNHPNQMVKLFGRGFNGWASDQIDPTVRFSSFNLRTLYPTYEVRLSRFTNTAQFINLINWSRRVGFQFKSLQNDCIEVVKTRIDMEWRRLISTVR